MKRTILTIFLIFIATFAVNAQKCEPKITETDDFTNKTTEYWGSTLTSMSVYSQNIKYLPLLFVYKENNKDKIVIAINVDGILDNTMVLNPHKWFEKGTEFMLKLDNEILTFTVEKSNIKKSKQKTEIELTSTISRENIEKLKNQKLLMGKVYPFLDKDEIRFQFKVSKGRDKKLKSQLDCFLKL